jgi:hypothetical protein
VPAGTSAGGAPRPSPACNQSGRDASSTATRRSIPAIAACTVAAVASSAITSRAPLWSIRWRLSSGPDRLFTGTAAIPAEVTPSHATG